jgi:putative transposase
LSDDYRAYLSLLVAWCGQRAVRIWAYCLMPNHVHLIVVPARSEGLARAIGETHRRYTRRVNFRENWRGYLWQGRFSSFVMDESYLLAATRYVERNPVKASLVARAQDWPWSSAAGHVTGRGDAAAEGQWLCERTAGWVCTWGEYLQERDESELPERMQSRESTGRPLGDEGFVKTVGKLLGRDLLPKRPGRKPKPKDQNGKGNR